MDSSSGWMFLYDEILVQLFFPPLFSYTKSQTTVLGNISTPELYRTAILTDQTVSRCM